MGQKERRRNPRRATGEWGDLAYQCARSVLDEGQSDRVGAASVASEDRSGCEAFVSLVAREYNRLTGHEEL